MGSQSTTKAARVFIDEVANGVASIPADSPCAAATRAYAANVNPSSPAVKAAMEAFINQVTGEGGMQTDSACATAAASYLDAYEAGATVEDSRLDAAQGFFEAFKSGQNI